MKRQKFGKKYWFDWNEPKGWFKKFIRRETRNLIKEDTKKEYSESEEG